MADVTIKVADRGPLLVKGEVELIDADGNAFTTKKVFALCRCGLSQKKPFCDGAHAGEFEDCARANSML
ncbi:CDGSH iron-sulfur domain-containing protein [Mechercharimyces sp. CAU 1602]|uniref:CDGSH iron-sulfur domain-containing protein n=1 Tax=Mechercharimyces sp. CAU 1602 TaxID=2973933 RepID=UPI002162DC0F|nr:CDGSH iron-sulfur domain-containing protein [Mechercharimyces sp. CAU 1602]MCS1351563.1 CDGSH iron-sulfur domain-containing protein [Mechercharimyces sp. CAU 1602]